MTIVTRTCHRCKVNQPIDQFYVDSEARASARRGKKVRQPCRSCNQAYHQQKRAPRQAYVDQIKRESGCMDCGLHPEYTQVLEFDHRPGRGQAFPYLRQDDFRDVRCIQSGGREVRRRLRELPPHPHRSQESVRPRPRSDADPDGTGLQGPRRRTRSHMGRLRAGIVREVVVP